MRIPHLSLMSTLTLIALMLMCTGALFFSSSYPLRAVISLVLCYAVSATALFSLLEHDLQGKRLLASGMAVALLWNISHEMNIFWDNYQVSLQRAVIIVTARGCDAVFPFFTRQDKFFFAGGDIRDVRGYEGRQAHYYGLRSVRAEGSD